MNKEQVKSCFEIKSGKHLLALKGRNVDIFREFVKDKNARVLDFGSGSGAFGGIIHGMGYKDIFSCDIDNYLAEGIKPFFKDFRKLDSSFDRFPWPDDFFDVVTAWEVFEHLENPHHALREIHRILRPGGVLIVSIPNVFHIVSRLIFLKRGLFPRWNETNNHISIFPRGIFEKTFLKHFNLIKEGYIYSKISLPGLNKISRYLPENQWFGNWVYYIMKKS